MIKLVIADMDGTLLNSQKQFSEGILQYIHKKSKEGILFAAASGRQYSSLKNSFEEIQEDMIYVAENGMYIVYKNQELFSHTMKKEEAMNFVRIGRSLSNAYVIVCGKKSAYVEKENEAFLTEAKRYYAQLEKIDSLDKIMHLDDEVLKIAIWCDQGTEKHIYPHFQHFNDFLVSVSAFDWMDIMPKGFNKGTAACFLQSYFHISKEETAVFGDYLNDLEMMKEAKYSYAMKNAHPQIIQASHFITQYSNEENGVYKELLQLLGN